jgi:predicted enzyme related to lactoylglutathione lyase
MNVPQFSAVAPCFPVADVGATLRWYQEQLGFGSDPFPEAEPYVFAILFRDQVEIMLQWVEGYEKPDLSARRGDGVWDAYIRVAGVKEMFESVQNSVTIFRPLRQQPYGAWEFEVKDPNGYLLVFSGTIEPEG